MAPSPPPSIGVHTCKGWQGLATSGELICCRTHSPATEAGWLNYRDWSGRDAREPFQKSCGSGQNFCPVETNFKLNFGGGIVHFV